MKTTMRRIMIMIMAVAIVLTALNPVTAQAATKKQVKLNKTKTTLTITKKKTAPTVTLKVKNTKKAVKWSTSSKKIATVTKVDKYSAKVTAKKAGTARITAKVGGKKYTCKVTVKDNRGKGNTNNYAEDEDGNKILDYYETEDGKKVYYVEDKNGKRYYYTIDGDDTVIGEPALGIYMCNCGYAHIPVYESGLGRGEQKNPRSHECTAEEWFVHMAEHRKNGESTDYKDTTKSPKPLGVRSCKCGYQMLIYTYGLSDEEYATWDKHQEEKHRKYHHAPEEYNWSSVSYKAFMDCFYKR